MADLARRFDENPLIVPADVAPSRPGLRVECVLNPGAFRFNGRIGLLLRVAEAPESDNAVFRAAIRDGEADGGVRILEVSRDDPDFEMDDPRVFSFRGETYTSTLSHLRLAWSDDGARFRVEDRPALEGAGEAESLGLEDARVAQVGDVYHLTYTSVSRRALAVSLARTRDWREFERLGAILPPDNKDCALFEDLVGGEFRSLHRPSSEWGGRNIWIARSPDGLHWGGHRLLAAARPGMWDEARVGAGAPPIRTEAGWIEIYHGADGNGRYCLGALLLDIERPERVLARSREPIMEPLMEYERKGFFGNCVFTNGHVVEGDAVLLYYGASDTVVCGARLSIAEILDTLL